MIDIGLSDTQYKKYRKQKIKVGYYHAPITDLNGLKCETKQCEECNQERQIFTLNPNRQNRKSDWICIDCLVSIPIDATHFSEYGVVTSEQPFPDFLDDAREVVSSEAFQELMQTPHYYTMQGSYWQCHCDDFMDYLGTWEAPDFTQNSPDGNGKKLFEAIAETYEHIWEEYGLEENEHRETWVDCLAHIFECRHCKTKLAYLEMD